LNQKWTFVEPSLFTSIPKTTYTLYIEYTGNHNYNGVETFDLLLNDVKYKMYSTNLNKSIHQIIKLEISKITQRITFDVKNTPNGNGDIILKKFTLDDINMLPYMKSDINDTNKTASAKEGNLYWIQKYTCTIPIPFPPITQTPTSTQRITQTPTSTQRITQTPTSTQRITQTPQTFSNKFIKNKAVNKYIELNWQIGNSLRLNSKENNNYYRWSYDGTHIKNVQRDRVISGNNTKPNGSLMTADANSVKLNIIYLDTNSFLIQTLTPGGDIGKYLTYDSLSKFIFKTLPSETASDYNSYVWIIE
jgi:hypothetical protein